MPETLNFKKFLNRLRQYEGLYLKAYKDSVGIPTVGIGTIRYPNGTAVKMGDTCTEEQAYEYATHEATKMFQELKAMLKVEQNEGQLIALLCLMYNIGTAGLKSSSVLKSINSKAPLAEIEANWMKWNKGTIGGKKVEIKGLTNRRASEFKIYSGQTKL